MDAGGSIGLCCRSGPRQDEIQPTDPGPPPPPKSQIANRESKILLPPGAAHILEFQYTSKTFIAPEQTRFKYRLDRLDKTWIAPGTARKAYYEEPLRGQLEVVTSAPTEVTNLNQDLTIYHLPSPISHLPSPPLAAVFGLEVELGLRRERLR